MDFEEHSFLRSCNSVTSLPDWQFLGGREHDFTHGGPTVNSKGGSWTVGWLVGLVGWGIESLHQASYQLEWTEGYEFDGIWGSSEEGMLGPILACLASEKTDQFPSLSLPWLTVDSPAPTCSHQNRSQMLQNDSLSCLWRLYLGSQKGLQGCRKTQTSTQLSRTYLFPSWPSGLNNWEAKMWWRKFTNWGDGFSDASCLFPLHFSPRGRLHHRVSEQEQNHAQTWKFHTTAEEREG